MSEERKAKLRRVMEKVIVEGNVDAMEELYAPSIVRHAGPPLPDSEGLAAYKEYMDAGQGIYSDYQLTIDDIICEGDTCAMRYRMQMTHTGYNPVFDLEATGKRATLAASITSRWENGKIVEEWAIVDLLGFLQQLGAIEAPGQS
ncbi:MAG: ester cyclase [Anaerolineae bacterium]